MINTYARTVYTPQGSIYPVYTYAGRGCTCLRTRLYGKHDVTRAAMEWHVLFLLATRVWKEMALAGEGGGQGEREGRERFKGKASWKAAFRAISKLWLYFLEEEEEEEDCGIWWKVLEAFRRVGNLKDGCNLTNEYLIFFAKRLEFLKKEIFQRKFRGVFKQCIWRIKEYALMIFQEYLRGGKKKKRNGKTKGVDQWDCVS